MRLTPRLPSISFVDTTLSSFIGSGSWSPAGSFATSVVRSEVRMTGDLVRDRTIVEVLGDETQYDCRYSNYEYTTVAKFHYSKKCSRRFLCILDAEVP